MKNINLFAYYDNNNILEQQSYIKLLYEHLDKTIENKKSTLHLLFWKNKIKRLVETITQEELDLFQMIKEL